MTKGHSMGSTDDRETVEQILDRMEQHAHEIEDGHIGSNTWDHGYCVASGAWAQRLRDAIARQAES